MTTTKNKRHGLTEIRNGRLRFHFHPGQWRAWESKARFVATIAGSRGGKTAFGPPWLYREMQTRGPGQYLVASPNMTILRKAALPAFLWFFKRMLGLGEYSSQRKIFEITKPELLFGRPSDIQTQIFFGHAEDPDSLAAMRALAAWLDEAGQKKFKLESWEEIQRRLSLDQGRALITTTPYDLGWLKQQVADRWRKGDPDYEVIRFESIANPAFPREEWERLQKTLPRWKFDMFLRGLFERPAGLIYSDFRDNQKVPRFKIPEEWKRYVGIDFGQVNMAAVFLAEDPGSRRLYVYREYHERYRTVRDHAQAMLHGEPGRADLYVGGSIAEGEWRREFQAAGLPVRECPIRDLEVGIDRVIAKIKLDDLFVFDDLAGLLGELGSYSRELDANGEPTEKIEDKEMFHRLDALRYIVAWLAQGGSKLKVWT
jgi:hypothetical protein